MTVSHLPLEIVRRILHDLSPSRRTTRNEWKLPYFLPTEDVTAYCRCALVSRVFLILSREIVLSKFCVVLTWSSSERLQRYRNRVDAFLGFLNTTTSSLRYPSSGLNLQVRFTDATFRRRLLDIFGQALPRIKSLACSFTEPDLSEDERHCCIQQLGCLLGQTRSLSVSGARTHAEVYQWIHTISVHCQELQLLEISAHFVPPPQEGEPLDVAHLTSCPAPPGLRKICFFPNQNFVAQAVMHWLSSSQVFLQEADFQALPMHRNSELQDILNSPVCRNLKILDLKFHDGNDDLSHLKNLREVRQIIFLSPHHEPVYGALHSLARPSQRTSSVHLQLRLNKATSMNDEELGPRLTSLDKCLAQLAATATPGGITVCLEAVVKREVTKRAEGIMVWFPELAQRMDVTYCDYLPPGKDKDPESLSVTVGLEMKQMLHA